MKKGNEGMRAANIIDSDPEPKKSLEPLREAWLRQIVGDRAISLSAIKVAVAISWHMNRQKNGLAWPGMSRLSKLTGLHQITVVRAVQWLEQQNHMQVMRTFTRAGRGNNRYMPTLWPEKGSADKDLTAENSEGGMLQGDYVPRSNGTTDHVAGALHKPIIYPQSEPLSLKSRAQRGPPALAKSADSDLSASATLDTSAASEPRVAAAVASVPAAFSASGTRAQAVPRKANQRHRVLWPADFVPDVSCLAPSGGVRNASTARLSASETMPIPTVPAIQTGGRRGATG